MKKLIELQKDKDNVAITGNVFIFPIKKYTEEGEDDGYDEELALIKLYQLTSKFNKKAGIVNHEERYFTQIGSHKGLKALINELSEDGMIEGRLVVHECIESEIPPEYHALYFSGKRDADPKERSRKKHKVTKEYLTHNGEQIFRFVKWTFDESERDILVEHD